MADSARFGEKLQGQALVDAFRAEHVRDQLRIGFWRGKYARDIGALLAAADLRISKGHNDTCGTALGDFPCSCGHDELHKAALTVRARANDPMESP